MAPPGRSMAIPAFLGAAPFRLGVVAAVAAAAVDQAVKLWLLYGFGLTARARVPVTPFLDLVLAWNTGISYGLFQESGPLWQWVLLGLKVTAVALLLIWLAQTRSRLGGVALGLIIGGALGNAVDRALYGAVADFLHLHGGAVGFANLVPRTLLHAQPRVHRVDSAQSLHDVLQ